MTRQEDGKELIIDRDKLQLTPYEQEIEDSLTDEMLAAPMTPESQAIIRRVVLMPILLTDKIQARVEEEKTKPVTFKAKKKEFEQFKINAKKMNLPYSKLLNALIVMVNRGEIRLK